MNTSWSWTRKCIMHRSVLNKVNDVPRTGFKFREPILNETCERKFHFLQVTDKSKKLKHNYKRNLRMLIKFCNVGVSASHTSRAGTSVEKLMEPQTKQKINYHGTLEEKNMKLFEGPNLEYFIANSAVNINNQLETSHNLTNEVEPHPYVSSLEVSGHKRKVFFETYGCQMNVNDTEIAWSILKNAGFERTEEIKQADVILVMTCAIREGAEQKIWNRLQHLKSLKRRRQNGGKGPELKIGILGCMAERLKEKLIVKERMLDIVAGPDSYRDLPRLLAEAADGKTAVNVLLSLEETYADIVPVRLNPGSSSAYVSIMRGCDNMCSYCIVPFTRGRERSRPVSTILDEIKILSDQGIKEVTLLGQNVNSYRDTSEMKYSTVAPSVRSGMSEMSRGFQTVYKPKLGGFRFADLLHKVSCVDPEMRIRFTSPHPKDFPDELLHVIREQANICKVLHLPAQSGSSEVLQQMRRGYTREAYLDLVSHVRSIVPGVAVTSDFMCGFCGETETDHRETLSLIDLVKYNFVYVFPYSMRQKTRAFHHLEDDVPTDVKARRVSEVVDLFRKILSDLNRNQIGKRQLVLVEGKSKKSDRYLAGRNDRNTKVIFPSVPIPNGSTSTDLLTISPGDYVVVEIQECSSQVLKGNPLYHTTLQKFAFL
ncbi:CDK5 regulatory subunit-associated protein 1-like [Limulus polyphemus]|uniref:CDK5 regulatory subunit-associated protein 1-like n=1 Tax=Limulus polyphemus TaxID=6850 RepID=A0ABM1BTM1_LIMPO|nr:CDK5 regulatory subunit-associated protein 1-like [Limulus polyphemus]